MRNCFALRRLPASSSPCSLLLLRLYCSLHQKAYGRSSESSQASTIFRSSQKVLSTALAKVENLTDWTHQKIEEVLRIALIEDLGLKPRIAFGAIRIAVTGSHISPPLFESLELLGKERSIARIKAVISK